MENNQQNHDQSELRQTHTVTLQKLLSQLDQLNVNDVSRPMLAEALAAAMEALRTTSGGVELSDADVYGHLSRIAQGLPSRDQERRQSAVNTLVELTNNVPSREDGNGPVSDLAKLVKQYD